ncbi:MAG TPA: uracil-DNA glycosylase family protein [Ktedonobacterales bacterium]|nr:uracil-DNA glycosylase family protein [Ktedonobacterales bacterium]
MMNEIQDRLTALQAQIAQCRRCVAAGHLVVANPVAGTRGRATDRIMLIGQAPGRLSVERGIPFGGPGGKILDQWMTRAGFPPDFLRTGVYLSALTRCFPGKNPKGKGDRAPSPAEMALCRPWLDAEVALVNPNVVLLVGGMAIRTFLGAGSLESFVGKLIAHDGRLWLPLPHPSGVSRWLNAPANQKLVELALALLSDWREKYMHGKESA